MERIDWLERAAIECMTEVAGTGDLIRGELNVLLTICLSGGGAALVLATKQDAYTVASLCVAVWLFGIAMIIAVLGKRMRGYPGIWNDPANLDQQGYSLEELRGFEIQNTQYHIEVATLLNRQRSKIYNRCLIASCLTPVVALAVYFLGF